MLDERLGELFSDEEVRKINAAFVERRKDIVYFYDNIGFIREQYPDEYVAISEQSIVGHSKIEAHLIRMLRDKRIELAFIERTYVNEKPKTQILPFELVEVRA